MLKDESKRNVGNFHQGHGHSWGIHKKGSQNSSGHIERTLLSKKLPCGKAHPEEQVGRGSWRGDTLRIAQGSEPQHPGL